MGEGLDSVFVKTLMGSNLYIRVTSYEINCNTRVTMDNSLSVLFAYAFASGLDTSRAGTRQIFFFSFSFHRFTSAHCLSLNFFGGYIGCWYLAEEEDVLPRISMHAARGL